MMRNEFMPASRSLMPMQSPEKPAPTMRTSTFVTAEFVEGAASSVMRGPRFFLLWAIPALRSERRKTRRSPAAIGELRESGGGLVARHAGRQARFSVRRERRRRGHLRRGAWSHLGELRPRPRE